MPMTMRTTALTIAGISLVFISLVECQNSSQCTQVDDEYRPCSCSFPNGSVIDLQSLALDDGSPKFKFTDVSYGISYLYNPCFPFTDRNCIDVAGCQGDNITKRSLGTQDEASFSTDDKGHISITYTGGNADRSMVVELICDEEQTTPTFVFLNETVPLQYTFKLTTVCACAGGCTGGGGGGGGNGGSPTKSNSSNIGTTEIVAIAISALLLVIIVFNVVGLIATNNAFKERVLSTFTPCIRCCSSETRQYSNI